MHYLFHVNISELNIITKKKTTSAHDDIILSTVARCKVQTKKATKFKKKNKKLIFAFQNAMRIRLYLTQSCRRFPAFVINQSTSAFSYLNISLNQKSDNNFLSSTVVEIPLTRGNSFS